MNRTTSLYSLLFTVFNDGLGWGIVLVIFAPLLFDTSAQMLPSDLSTGTRNLILSCLIASYAITQFFSVPIIGSLSDHFGRKKVLLWTIFGAMVSFTLSAIAIMIHSITLLFTARLLAGLFSGNSGTAQASIADLSTESTKAKNLSLTGIVGGLSWIIGPPIGGLLATPKWGSWFNFSTPFWFTAILFISNLIWVAKGYTETYEKKGKHDWKQEIKDLMKLSKIPKMAGWLWVTGLFYFGWFLFILYFPTLFVLQFQFSQDTIGLFSGYIAIFWMIASTILNRYLAERFNTEKMLLYMLAILGITFLIGTWTGDITAWLISFPILSFCASIGWVLAMTLTSNLAGSENQGKIFGITQSLMSLAILIAPLCSGFAANYNIKLPLYLGGFCFLAIYFFALGLHAKSKRI